MAVNIDEYNKIVEKCDSQKVILVAVSKTKPIEDIEELYNLGQRIFGENYVQELVDKQLVLPKDIEWHFLGHLQTNKVKYIASFVRLIHGVDSLKLLQEINKQGIKNDKKIAVLLQLHIAKEDTKFGLNEDELNILIDEVMANETHYKNIEIKGLMGMASFTDNNELVANEFEFLNKIYKQLKTKMGNINTLSMGMSGDYELAIAKGSSMIRVGSLLFGKR